VPPTTVRSGLHIDQHFQHFDPTSLYKCFQTLSFWGETFTARLGVPLFFPLSFPTGPIMFSFDYRSLWVGRCPAFCLPQRFFPLPPPPKPTQRVFAGTAPPWEVLDSGLFFCAFPLSRLLRLGPPFLFDKCHGFNLSLLPFIPFFVV